MIDFFNDIFNYTFLQNALLAALLSAVSCGIMGSYMVVKRMVFLGGGITHSSFGGVGIAYYMGISPTIGALIGALISALTIESISRKSLREDTAIGILWSVGMAVGVLFVMLTPGYAPNLMSFLFGNILMVSGLDLLLLTVLDVMLITVLVCFYRYIVYIAMDSEFSRSMGLPVKLVGYCVMVFLSLAIVLNIKVVGIMLLMSLLTIPTAIAGCFVRRFSRLVTLSIVVALIGLVFGIMLSYYYDLPAGAISVLLLGVCYFVVRGVIMLWRRCKP